MSEKEDLESEGRLQGGDGWQYRIKFEDGLVEHARDHDAFDAVLARVSAAKECIFTPGKAKSFADVCVSFSGARAVEGADEDGKITIGPIRGRAVFAVSKIIGISYSSVDGTELPSQAYEAAVALLDVQREAIARLGQVAESEPAKVDGDEAADGLL